MLFGQLLNIVFYSDVVSLLLVVMFCTICVDLMLFCHILSGEFDAFVWKHKDISDEQEQSASLLKECILLRDGVLSLPEIFTLTDIENIISEVYVACVILTGCTFSF